MKTRKFYAIFEHDKQMTAWRTCRDATCAAFRRSFHKNSSAVKAKARKFTMQMRRFIEPAKEAA